MREMGKILSNLIESAQAAKHARQLLISAQSRTKDRAKTVDTKKNREALIAAIDVKDQQALEHLIDIGVPLATEKDEAPLLGRCVQRRWTCGFTLLLEAGAPHAWERQPESGQLLGGGSLEKGSQSF